MAALTRTAAAAAAALRRSAAAVTSSPHRAATMVPLLPRFGRLHAPRCYRLGSPPGSEEGLHKVLEGLEDMDRDALLQYAKKVTVEKDDLMKCKYDPVKAEVNDETLKTNLQAMSKRIDEIQKLGEKHRDVTSLYIKNVGSFNVIAIGSAAYTLYQIWGKAMRAWTKPAREP